MTLNHTPKCVDGIRLRSVSVPILGVRKEVKRVDFKYRVRERERVRVKYVRDRNVDGIILKLLVRNTDSV